MESFPLGTVEILVYMELMPFDLERAEDKLLPAMKFITEDYLDWDYFSFQSVYNNLEINACIELFLEAAERWFELGE